MGAIWGIASLAGPLREAEVASLVAAYPARSCATSLFTHAALFQDGAGAPAAARHGTPTVGLAADVRLDARGELIARLENVPRGCHDDGLILRAWRKWGANFPSQLCGDYAIAIWDDDRGELLCVRDHVGARPLYYSATPQRMYFASHIRTLLAIPGVSAELCEDFLSGILHNHYDSSDSTYFSAIRKLPIAHGLSAGRNGIRLWRHWDPSTAPDVRFTRDADYVDAAREVLNRACDRLRGLDCAGVHLTGGLDSSSVAVLAAREQRRQGKRAPEAFCWQPRAAGIVQGSWEHAFIDAVAAQEGMTSHYCEATPQDMLETIRGDPARDPITQAQFLEIAVQRKAASLGVETILTGWGGDEGLSYYGRGYYADLFFRGRWRRVYREARHRTAHPFRLVASEVLTALHPDAPDIVKALLKGQRYKKGWNNFVHPDFARRVRPPRMKHWRESSIRARLASAWASGVHAERMESWYCHGARAGIVYAYPLLDRRVLEFAAGLPPEQFVRGPWTRWLMRKSVEGILPPEVCWHRDKGEPVRFPATVSTIQHVMEKIGEGLNAAPALPPRSRYVDMPRLLGRLRPESIRGDPRAGGLLRTVQFLELNEIDVTL